MKYLLALISQVIITIIGIYVYFIFLDISQYHDILSKFWLQLMVSILAALFCGLIVSYLIKKLDSILIFYLVYSLTGFIWLQGGLYTITMLTYLPFVYFASIIWSLIIGYKQIQLKRPNRM